MIFCYFSNPDIEWTSHGLKSSTTGPTPKVLPPFTLSTGLTPQTKQEKSPLQVFQLYITTILLEGIVKQSNAYATSKGGVLDLHIEELKAFIGMNIAMGMLRLPQIRDYWAHNEILSTLWLPSIMPRDRFFSILRFLHLVDNSLQKKKGEDGFDPLFKIRPMIDHLSAVFPRYYQLGQQLLIDEMMIGTRCHVSFLQYLPKKPTRFGIKVFVNAEAKSGYVLTFQVYTGKREANPADEVSKLSVSHRVVKELLQSYLGKGHWVFTDNYYTGVELYEDLLRNNTYATGTFRANRKHFPCVLKEKRKLSMGQYHFATSENLLAVLWHDRRDVFVLSTAHNQSVTSVMKRPKGSREKVPVASPTCVQDYNMYMGGVDLSDQHLSYYSLTQRCTLKWWKKFFWRMIDISILNSWIIFHANFPNSTIDCHRAFRIELVHQLAQPLLSIKASPENPLSYSTKGVNQLLQKSG